MSVMSDKANVVAKPIGIARFITESGKCDAKNLGPILGQRKINPKQFCDAVNALTKNFSGPISVHFEYYEKGAYVITGFKLESTVSMLKKKFGITKGNSTSGKTVLKTIDFSELKSIAEAKFQDFGIGEIKTPEKIITAMKTIAGTAKSIGMLVINIPN
jgi:large subunit ribosomal protein L11